MGRFSQKIVSQFARSGSISTPFLLFVLISGCFFRHPGLYAQDSSQKNRSITPDELFENWRMLESWDHTERSYRAERRSALMPDYAPQIQVTKVKPGWDLFVVSHNGSKAVLSLSPRYFFQIWHEPDKEGWALRNMDTESSKPEVEQFMHLGKVMDIGRPLSTIFTSGKAYLPDPQIYSYSQQEGFKLISITPEGGNIDKVDFEFKDSTGVLHTDRSRSSMIVRSEITIKGKDSAFIVEMKQRELYVDLGSNSIPRCKKIVFITKDAKDGKILEHQVLDFSDYDDQPIPEDEFLLSHYGLPEPMSRSTVKNDRTYQRLIAIGLFCGILAILFQFLQRRRALKA